MDPTRTGIMESSSIASVALVRIRFMVEQILYGLYLVRIYGIRELLLFGYFGRLGFREEMGQLTFHEECKTEFVLFIDIVKRIFHLQHHPPH